MPNDSVKAGSASEEPVAFIEWLRELRDGETLGALAMAFREAVACVEETRLPAEVMLTLTVHPTGFPGVVDVNASVVSKVDHAGQTDSRFFVLPDNSLTRRQSHRVPLRGIGVTD